MIGQTLSHYTVEEVLGKGGMGTVYRARDNRLGRAVALKVLSGELTSNSERQRRFLQEARSASAVTHPSIAQIYDVGEADGITYIAMELVDGQSLRQLIAREELDLLVTLEIAIQVGEGLRKAHEAGIIHRDIKSGNIMLTKDGHAKILDFGLAKPIYSAEAEGNASEQLSQVETMVKTQVGTVVGTVAYMSPEQARGRELDHRSDLFSLGVVIYEMATGQLPFAGETMLDTMHAIAFDETRPLTAFRENLPPQLQRIVTRSLEKKAEDRYGDAAEMVGELRALKRDTESGVTRALPLSERIRDGFQSLRRVPPKTYAAWGIGSLLLGTALFLFAGSKELDISQLVIWGMISLVLYRYVKNRRGRFMKNFVRSASKMSAVQLIVVRDDCATVVVDKREARLYVRLNAMIDDINRKSFFGKPISVSVRDNVEPDEFHRLLRGSGVYFVRDDMV